MNPTSLDSTERHVPILDFSQDKAEKLLEKIENMKLLELTENRAGNNTTSFESFANEHGFLIEELEELSESIEFE